jgi:hypothetical protein
VVNSLTKPDCPVLAVLIPLQVLLNFRIVYSPSSRRHQGTFTYPLQIMEHVGFGQKWRNWISILWCSASSSFLLNGEPGKSVLHCKGVRQGDPLSPMLFLLAMEPLHRLFKKARDWRLLRDLSPGCDTFRVSLFADAAAVFIRPYEQDWTVTNSILDLFAEASGLCTNLAKTEIFPIRCQDITLDFFKQCKLCSL